MQRAALPGLYLHLADYASYQPTVTTVRIVHSSSGFMYDGLRMCNSDLASWARIAKSRCWMRLGTSLVIVESTPSGAPREPEPCVLSRGG